MVGSSSLLEKSIRGSDTNSTTIDAILRERNGSSSASSSCGERVKSVPVIAPLGKKRSRDYHKWDEDARMHSDNKAKRNAEYYDVAFRGFIILFIFYLYTISPTHPSNHAITEFGSPGAGRLRRLRRGHALFGAQFGH
jgi:hypothetical protein